MPASTAIKVEVLTFLMTDVVGSTKLWQQHASLMPGAMATLQTLVESSVEENGGRIIKARGEGDSHFCVFRSASGAVQAAVQLQLKICAAKWPFEGPIRIRIAVHSGEAEEHEGDYHGTTINRCARIREATHGGQILVSQACHLLVDDTSANNVSFRDLGNHILRDFNEPEQLLQVWTVGLESEFPPPRLKGIHPTNLPSDLSSTIGREADWVEIKRLFDRYRLITLKGTPGTGKTHLALAVARSSLHRFPDGVYFVDLVGASPDGLAVMLLQALGLPRPAAEDSVEVLCAAVVEGTRLILLDNCEHLHYHVAQLVKKLISSANGLTILATSRHPLKLRGEAVWEVGPLAVPPVGERLAPEDASKYASIQLFAARAKERNQRFALTRQNVQDVADLCRKLDGIPLAIEIAAARSTHLTPSQMLGRLTIETPTESLDVDERHHTLLAAISWSVNLLPLLTRKLFARLSVFVGSWTLEASEAVCSDEDLPKDAVLGALSDLVDHSLVVAYHSSEAGTLRYRMLESIREAALSECDELDTLRARHGQWFAQLAQTADSALVSPDRAIWLRTLNLDHGNLVAAVDAFAVGSAESQQYVRNLRRYLVEIPDTNEAIRILLSAVGSEADPPTADSAHIANALGVMYWQRGDVEGQNKFYRLALKRFTSLGMAKEQATVAHNLATALASAGQLEEARTEFLESVAVFERLNDYDTMCRALANLASEEYLSGNAETALIHLNRAESVSSQLADPRSIERVHRVRASCLVKLGRHDEAKQYYILSLEQLSDLGDRAGAAHVAQSLVNQCIEDGDFRSAAILLGFWLETFALQPGRISERERMEMRDAETLLHKSFEEQAPSIALGRGLSLNEAISMMRQLLKHPGELGS